MIWFTSDWHLGETRIGDINKGEFNPFFRPFNSVVEQDTTIINGINAVVKEDDTLYHIGDVAVTDEAVSQLELIFCKNMILIEGNYDTPRLELLKPYFKEILPNADVYLPDSILPTFLTHCPVASRKDAFNIVGHIHGLWTVKRNMINVSTDAWHFKPVSEKEIVFMKNAIDKGFYDENVFYGEKK